MTIRTIPIAAIAIILLTACNTPPKEEPLLVVDGMKWQAEYTKKPNTMSIMIGGAFGVSYELTYDGRELKYYKAGNFFSLKSAKPELIKATKKDWEEFLVEFRKLKHANWHKHYEDRKINDGTYWRAVIYYGTDPSENIVSSGSNAYPEDFPQLLHALKKLIGDRRFE